MGANSSVLWPFSFYYFSVYFPDQITQTYRERSYVVQHEEVLEDPSSRVLNILVTRAPLPPLRPPGSRSDVGRSLSLAGICPERNLTSQEISPRRPTFELFRKIDPQKRNLEKSRPPEKSPV